MPVINISFEFETFRRITLSPFRTFPFINPIYIYYLQAFLQVFEREITDIFQGFANRLNHRLNRTPGVRVLKRLMERIRGKRKVNFLHIKTKT